MVNLILFLVLSARFPDVVAKDLGVSMALPEPVRPMGCVTEKLDTHSRVNEEYQDSLQHISFANEVLIKEMELGFSNPVERQEFKKFIIRNSTLDRSVFLEYLQLVNPYQHDGVPLATKEELMIIFSHPEVLKEGLPKFKYQTDYAKFAKLFAGDINDKTKAFAFFNHNLLKKTHPEISKFLKAASKTQQMTLKVEGDLAQPEKTSFLWYPIYPVIGARPTCTHTKIVVKGEVWSTMAEYSLMHSQETHSRKARISFKDSFVEYVIRAKPHEIERMIYLLENNDRRGTGLGQCVQGACGVLAQAGVMRVPPPFNQIPSLAALYLSVSRFLPGRVIQIKFHGKSLVKSLLSLDLVVDGVVIGAVIYIEEKIRKNLKE